MVHALVRSQLVLSGSQLVQSGPRRSPGSPKANLPYDAVRCLKKYQVKTQPKNRFDMLIKVLKKRQFRSVPKVFKIQD